MLSKRFDLFLPTFKASPEVSTIKLIRIFSLLLFSCKIMEKQGIKAGAKRTSFSYGIGIYVFGISNICNQEENHICMREVVASGARCTYRS